MWPFSVESRRCHCQKFVVVAASCREIFLIRWAYKLCRQERWPLDNYSECCSCIQQCQDMPLLKVCVSVTENLNWSFSLKLQQLTLMGVVYNSESNISLCTQVDILVVFIFSLNIMSLLLYLKKVFGIRNNVLFRFLIICRQFSPYVFTLHIVHAVFYCL